MMSSPISNSRQIIAEQESISCCQKITTEEVLGLIASIANGALIGVAICFAFSNPAGWVITATIISGALVGALICSIAIFAYRHFNNPVSAVLAADGTQQNAVRAGVKSNRESDQESDRSEIVDSNASTGSYTSVEMYHATDSQSASEGSDSQSCVSEKSNSQDISIEGEDIDVVVEPFSELQKKLIYNLLEDALNAGKVSNTDLDNKAVTSSLKFLNSYGFKKKVKQNYEGWIHIWESDSISRYPHLLNSVLTIDIKKMDGNIVKGFIYDGRPFIAFKINPEMVNIFDDISTEEQMSPKPEICIFYDHSSTEDEILYEAKVIDESGELSCVLNNEQFKSLIQEGTIMDSSENSLSSSGSESYSSEPESYDKSESYSSKSKS